MKSAQRHSFSRKSLGSARVSRVGFGVSPKQPFLTMRVQSHWARKEKSAIARRNRQHARRVRYPERHRFGAKPKVRTHLHGLRFPENLLHACYRTANKKSPNNFCSSVQSFSKRRLAVVAIAIISTGE